MHFVKMLFQQIKKLK